MNNDQKIPARMASPVVLKDKQGRGGVRYDLKRVFGFLPEVVIIQKVKDKNNTFTLSAVLTDDEIKKEEKLREDLLMQQTPIKV